jgi:hypothetical protein
MLDIGRDVAFYRTNRERIIMSNRTANLRELQRLALSLSGHGVNAGPSVAEGDPRRALRSGFHELVAAAPGDEVAARACALVLATRAARTTRKMLCFCSLRGEAQEYGQLYGAGLAASGVDADRVLMVTVPNEKDLLWVIEEGVTSGAFGAVAGMLPAAERLYDFTSSRRLKLKAQTTSLYFIRHRQARSATAAHGRWRIAALPSEQPVRDACLIAHNKEIRSGLVGTPRLRLELERMGGQPPQSWEMPLSSLWEDEIDVTRDFHMAPLLENGPTCKTG